MEFSTSLVLGERHVEIPGKFSPLEPPTRPDQIVIPELQISSNYANYADITIANEVLEAVLFATVSKTSGKSCNCNCSDCCSTKDHSNLQTLKCCF
jgi:hypothetical protein